MINNINTQLIIEMHKNGIGIKKISTILKVTILEVQQCLINNNINWRNKKYCERDIEICELYTAGERITNIANKLKIDRHTVSDVLKINNIYINKKEKIDSDSKKERNDSIIQLYNEGLSMRAVANKINVSATTVKNVLNKFNIQAREAHVKGHSKGTSKNRFHTFNLNYFEKIDTEEKAYWLGFLYADGYISNRGLISIGLQEKDEIHLEKFKKCIDANSVIIKHKKRTKSVLLDICSVKMCDDLTKLGCVQKKSITLKFPTEDQVPRHLTHHFMRGYFDGDGCIYIQENEANICFSVVGTTDFLNIYEKILLKGINKAKPNKRVHQDHWNDNTDCISYGGRTQVIKIFNYLYKNATIYLERKYEKFNTLLPS